LALRQRLPGQLPVVFAALLPILFIPTSVDAYILPRATLVFVFAPLLFGLGALSGGRLGELRLPALAVVGAAILAWALSPAPQLGLVGAYGRYESVLMRICYVGLFFGAAWLKGPHNKRTAGHSGTSPDTVVKGLLIGASIVALEAIYEAVTKSLPVPDGNLGQHNLLGILLGMALPLAVERGLKGWRWLPLVPILGLGLYASESRGGWLAALIGMIVLVLWLVPRRRLSLTLGTGLALIAVAAVIFAASPLHNLNNDPGTARLGVWRDSIGLIAARPLEGWGEEGFGLAFGHWQTQDWQPGSNFDRAHSVPLDLLASQGALGLGACFWFWVVLWRRLGRARSRSQAGLVAALAAYTAWGLVNFDWAPVTAIFWLLGGLAWEPPPPRSPGRLRLIPALTLVPLGAALIAFALLAQVADLAYYADQPRLAARLDPLQPKYHAAIGTYQELQRAADLHDPDPDTYVRLGQMESDPARAAADYRRALAIYPFDVSARRLLNRQASTGPAAR